MKRTPLKNDGYFSLVPEQALEVGR